MSVVHALRHTGRAAREDQQCEVVGLRQRRRIDRKRCILGPPGDVGLGACAKRQDRGDAELLGGVARFLLDGRIANDQARVSAVENLLELARHEERIDRRHLRTQCHDGHQGDIHLDRVRHHHDHALAAADSAVGKLLREPANRAAEFRVGDPALLIDDCGDLRVRLHGSVQHVHEARILGQVRIGLLLGAYARQLSHLLFASPFGQLSTAIQEKKASIPTSAATVAGRFRNSRPTQLGLPLKIRSTRASKGKNSAPLTV